MKYSIVSGLDTLELIKNVQAALEEGCRPVGGAFHGDGWFHQTMILIEPEPEPPKPTTEQLIKMAMKNLTDDPEMPPTSTAQQP